MILITIYLVFIPIASANKCYWNDPCPYQLYSSKTTYDAVRGDLRDLERPANCEAVSLWSLHRHGNRNPGSSVMALMKVIAELKDQIVQSYEEGRSQLCAQDVDLFRKWKWNETLEVSASYLTGQGYEELYNIGRRVREAFPELLKGTEDDYYFRPTNEQRTVTSGIAFVHGLTEGTNMSLAIDDAVENDTVIRPYQHCDRYQELVKGAPAVTDAIEAFMNTPEYTNIKNTIQQRLGITYQLTNEDIYSFYEMCRFYRSWELDLKSPWCAVFTYEDLVILEYRDDLRHYYRNGYGSWVNTRLGQLPMKDLFETISSVTNGSTRKITSYFTHDTMMEMVYCALELYKDPSPLVGSEIMTDRLWRSSLMGSKAVNLMAVLNRCQESGSEAYRVQIFLNEKLSDLCPLSGCTWNDFQEKFQKFTVSNLDFCSLAYTATEDGDLPSKAVTLTGVTGIIVAIMLAMLFR